MILITLYDSFKNISNKVINFTKRSYGSFTVLILVFSIAIFLSMIYINKLKTTPNEDMSLYLTEINTKNISSIKKQVDNDIKLLHTLSNFIGKSGITNTDSMIKLLKEASDESHFKRMGIVKPDGVGRTTDGHTLNFSDRDWFKPVMSGETFLSDKLIDRVDGKNIIAYSVPIYDGESVIGALFVTHDPSMFEDLINTTSFKGKGFSYIIKNDGDVIITPNNDYAIKDMKNFFESSKIDLSSAPGKADEMINNIKTGKSGTLKYSLQGTNRFLNYAPIGVNDWYIVSVALIDSIGSKFDYIVGLSFRISFFILIAFIILLMITLLNQRRNKDSLHNLAFIDELTGEMNWNKFQIDYHDVLKNNKSKSYVFVALDVDKFNYINNIFNYEEGNKVLIHMSDTIQKSISKNELFARISADHFAMLLEYENEDALIQRLKCLNKEICNFDDRFIANHKIIINFAIYKIKDPKRDLQVVSDNAKLTLKTIKGGHESSYAFYNEEIKQKLLFEKQIENVMHDALKNNEFEVYLQPKYDLETGEISGAEALTRWNRKGEGLIPPMNFIPIFEKNGFIANLDMYVFEQIFKTLRDWSEKGYKLIPISVNLSRFHLHDLAFIDNLKTLSEKYDISPSLIEIEITESAVFDNMDIFLYVIKKLKNIGFVLSMDDFGTGYSSLNMLKEIPIDVLKIDKEFFDESIDIERGRTVVLSVISMAKQLNIKVVSEGVETESQANFLRDIGCEMAQGYFFSRPMPIGDFENNYINTSESDEEKDS